MNKHRIGRIVSMLVGGVVLFGLEQGFDIKFYFAIPAGILAYTVTLVAFTMLVTDTPAK